MLIRLVIVKYPHIIKISEPTSLGITPYAVFCLKKKKLLDQLTILDMTLLISAVFFSCTMLLNVFFVSHGAASTLYVCMSYGP